MFEKRIAAPFLGVQNKTAETRTLVVKKRPLRANENEISFDKFKMHFQNSNFDYKIWINCFNHELDINEDDIKTKIDKLINNFVCFLKFL